jgi:hypothetical protein
MTAAVTEGGRYRRPLHKAGGGDVSGRYRKRPLQEAVTGSGRYMRPLQEAGGGDGSGRYINNVLRQDASAVTYNRYKFVTVSLPKRLRNSQFASETATWIQKWFKISVGNSRELSI